MKKEFLTLTLITFLFLNLNLISANTHLIINSENWKDVYSGIHYANLKGYDNDFLTSTGHATTILNGIDRKKNIEIISSQDTPHVISYTGIIENSGYNNVNEIKVDESTTELIQNLPNIKNFIVVDDSYGYNAIATTPYAIATNSWVFLANKINIQKIDDILQDRNINNLLIYGYVDSEIIDTLEKYNPKIINNQDKFEDNIEITKNFLDLKSTTQVLLTNGDFIEKELMMGNYPVLFTGKENVPDQIKEYLQNSEIEIGVLIGNELIGAATNIRRSTGISVMAKFARGARTQTGGAVAAVEGLDLFPIPSPSMSLDIYSAEYNTATSELEIIYKSDSNVPIYLKGTITVNANGETIKVGDAEPVFASPGNYKTVTYSLDLQTTDTIEVDIYTIYGETKTSLDRVLEKTLTAEIVTVIDSCQIEIKQVKYNKQDNSFKVEIENTGDVNCWVNTELQNVKLSNAKETIGSETPIKINSGKKGTLKISKELTDSDIENNPSVEVIAYYGENQIGLVNILKGNFTLKIESLTPITYAMILLLLIILTLTGIIVVAKRKEVSY
ncbi:MAG: hypothetical protein OQK82_03070 [Candidatus Pacearchaeota archaeon]|nr:hypothetical protein [Candidatus Pacearchaeota archaeon]